MCVCVCFWIYECFTSMLRYVFESLTCWLDLWLSSLLVAFLFMCFSSLEKLIFFKLDSSSTDSFLSRFSFSFLYSISTASRSIKISGFLLDRISTASRSIEISGILLDNFFDPLRKILVLFVCSIDSRQILDPSRPSFSRRQILDRFSSIEI